MQDIITILRKNNYKIKSGTEGDIILALAQYAATDSNLSNNQIGDRGKEVAEITKKLIQENPNIANIINPVVPEMKKELQECKILSQKRLLEARQWAAKKFLAGLLILAAALFAAPTIQAAALENVQLALKSHPEYQEQFIQNLNNMNEISVKGTSFDYAIASPFTKIDSNNIDTSKNDFVNKEDTEVFTSLISAVKEDEGDSYDSWSIVLNVYKIKAEQNYTGYSNKSVKIAYDYEIIGQDGNFSEKDIKNIIVNTYNTLKQGIY